jgi:hypothetical protein
MNNSGTDMSRPDGEKDPAPSDRHPGQIKPPGSKRTVGTSIFRNGWAEDLLLPKNTGIQTVQRIVSLSSLVGNKPILLAILCSETRYNDNAFRCIPGYISSRVACNGLEI